MLQGPKLLQPERSSSDLPPTPNYLMGKWNAASDLQTTRLQSTSWREADSPESLGSPGRG